MKCQRCSENAVAHLTLCPGGAAGEYEELHLCEGHAGEQLASLGDDARGGPTTGPGDPDEVTRFEIEAVLIWETRAGQLVRLREAGGRRLWSVTTGIYEATALDRKLKRLPSPRPLAHDGWADTLAALGGEVREVVVRDCRDGTFLAVVRLRQGAGVVELDSRPSDAFVLAAHCGAPIYIAGRAFSEGGR
jgi:bifunctional DNase/RNase